MGAEKHRRRVGLALAVGSSAWLLGCGHDCYELATTTDTITGEVSYASASVTASGAVSVDRKGGTQTAPPELGMVHYGIHPLPPAGDWVVFGFLDVGIMVKVPPAAGVYSLQDLGACLTEMAAEAGAGEYAVTRTGCLPLNGTLDVTQSSTGDCTTGSEMCKASSCPPICAWTFQATLMFSTSAGTPEAVSATLAIRHDETPQKQQCVSGD